MGCLAACQRRYTHLWRPKSHVPIWRVFLDGGWMFAVTSQALFVYRIEDYGAALSITGSDIVISNIEKPVVICREVTTGSDYDIIITEKG